MNPQDVISSIIAGDFNADELAAIKRHASAALKMAERQNASGRSLNVGDMGILCGNLSPKYMIGAIVRVTKINRTTVVVEFPENPRYRKFSGQSHVRVPITCIKPAETVEA